MIFSFRRKKKIPRDFFLFFFLVFFLKKKKAEKSKRYTCSQKIQLSFDVFNSVPSVRVLRICFTSIFSSNSHFLLSFIFSMPLYSFVFLFLVFSKTPPPLPPPPFTTFFSLSFPHVENKQHSHFLLVLKFDRLRSWKKKFFNLQMNIFECKKDELVWKLLINPYINHFKFKRWYRFSFFFFYRYAYFRSNSYG